MIYHIKILATPSLQIEYQEDVPSIIILDELLSLWFDNFHPESELFKSSFSNAEIHELLKFHELFDSKVDSIPDVEFALQLQAIKEWREVQSHAAKIIEDNGWQNVV